MKNIKYRISGDEILRENARRFEKIFTDNYNPITGFGSLTSRDEVTFTHYGERYTYYLPKILVNDPVIKEMLDCGDVDKYLLRKFGTVNDELRTAFDEYFINRRLDEDFEFWAITCVTVPDIKSGTDTRFKLNKTQRKRVQLLESLRTSGVPIRIIDVKSRQQGASTLYDIYGAWIQIRRKKGWNMAIVTDIEPQAYNIRAKYDKLLSNYPDFAGKIEMKRWKQTKHKYIPQRDCTIQIASMTKPNALRSNTFKIVHFSEVAFYQKTQSKTPEQLIASLSEGVVAEPETMIILESTANGVGNYFHKQWLAAVENKSVYKPIFIGWQEDTKNFIPLDSITSFLGLTSIQDFYNNFSPYEEYLWGLGLTLEQIAWYRFRLQEKNNNEWLMKEENPTTWQEAFQSSGRRVFPPEYVNQQRKYIKEPKFIGDIIAKNNKGKDAFSDIKLVSNPEGNLKIWTFPPDENDKEYVTERYIVSVDIGGSNPKSDYSVITVIDRYWMHEPDGIPEIAARWRGHIDHDLLAWKAAQISRLYSNALLVFEVNKLHSDRKFNDTEGDHTYTVINEIANFYENIYVRQSFNNEGGGKTIKFGFFTSEYTKPMIIDFLLSLLRDKKYIERDILALDEYESYEYKQNSITFGAVEGAHDDIVMSNAIGLWVAYNAMGMPKIINKKPPTYEKILIRNPYYNPPDAIL